MCLETLLLPGRMESAERIASARALRANLAKGQFKARDIGAMKREGRQ